jgi:hypothetical protein
MPDLDSDGVRIHYEVHGSGPVVLLSHGYSASSAMWTDQHRSADGLAHAARGMLSQRDAAVIESLPTIAVPTLVLVGADDAPFLAATDHMAAKIPDATKVVLDDAGHAANVHQPAAFNAAVAGFLEGLVDRIQHMAPLRRLPELVRKGARCAVMGAHHKRRATRPAGSGSRPSGPISRLLGASSILGDGPASPAGALLPRNRDMGS